jgi:hypothetical protein
MVDNKAFLAPGDYPLLAVRKIENPNKMWATPIVGGIAKAIYLIPVGIWLYLLLLAVMVVTIINSFMVFFTGQYWEMAYRLALGVMRLEAKVGFFFTGLTDRYPGFSLDNPADDLFSVDMAMPTAPSRGFAIPLFGGIVRGILLIPFSIFAQVIATAAELAVIVASIPVFMTGQYPQSLFELVRDGTRLYLSAAAYFLGLSDDYPSFSISMENPNVKWIFIGLGILITFGQFVGNLAQSLND